MEAEDGDEVTAGNKVACTAKGIMDSSIPPDAVRSQPWDHSILDPQGHNSNLHIFVYLEYTIYWHKYQDDYYNQEC